MGKKITLIFLIMIFSISFGGCKSNKPELMITIDKTKIDFINVKEPSDNKEVFKVAFKEMNAKKIKHVKIGEKVTLNFGYTPDQITIQEIFLNNNGEMLYSDKEIKDISYTQENNDYFFIIEKSIISGLSSFHTEDKTDLRGYKITSIINKGEDKKVYIFVIRTDSE